MKILVFAHQLEIGGTQTNAIELSAALRDLHGHEVVIFATPGPMAQLIEQKRLRYLPAPDAWIHPSPARAFALRRAVRCERPDLIHVWDWWGCLDAFYFEHLVMGVPLVVTDMMMSLTRILPKALPTTFGTPEVVDQARAAGRRRVDLLLPPVDVQFNAPGVVEAQPFRDCWSIKDDEIMLLVVSRLAASMKAEGVRRAIAAVQTLGHSLPLRLVIVGDGEARAELEGIASQVNCGLQRNAITFTGPLLDPRPAYATADIVLGMGGSALRAMAFAKPVIVLGERGFSEAFTQATAPSFYYKGFYGTGTDSSDNRRLVHEVRTLAQSPTQLPALGDFSRRFVLEHFSLERIAGRLSQICHAAVRERTPFQATLADGLRTTGVWLRERRIISYRFRQWLRSPPKRSQTQSRPGTKSPLTKRDLNRSPSVSVENTYNCRKA